MRLDLAALACICAWGAILVALNEATALDLDPSGHSPLISTTNVLLPRRPGLVFPIRLSRGCWELASRETTSSSPSLGASGDDDELFDVIPIDRKDAEIICKPNDAQDDYPDEEDEACFGEFRLRVREGARLGVSVALIFRPRKDFSSSTVGKEDLRVDVRLGILHKLEILTTTKRIEIGERDTLQVIARDADSNVFSTISGLSFSWSFESKGGADYVALSPIADDEDKSKHSALGLSTGRVTVAVREAESRLEAKVELTVSRTLSVCPGHSVGLIVGSKLAPAFCMRKLGCFATREDWERVRTSKDSYDWKENAISYPTHGKFLVKVDDQKEPSNSAFSVVFVGALRSVTLFLAPFGSTNTANTKDQDDCKFARSKSTQFPPIAKVLPPHNAYREPISGRFVLVKNKPYVLLSLAGLGLNNVDDAPLFAAPFTHEAFNYELEEKAAFEMSTVAHALKLIPKRAGRFNLKVTLRDQVASVTLHVVDELRTIPSGVVTMTFSCELPIQILGGSGIAKARIKAPQLAGLELNQTSGSVVPMTADPISQEYSGFVAIRSSIRDSAGKLIVLDELDESDITQLDIRVLPEPDGFRFVNAPLLEVLEGTVFTAQVKALDNSGRPLDCCAPSAYMFDVADEDIVSNLNYDAKNLLGSSICASKVLTAVEPGRTQIRFSSGNREAFLDVLVVPGLRADPPTLQMAVGDERDVKLVGGSENAAIQLIEPSKEPLALSGRIFQAKCTQAGKFTHKFEAISENLATLSTMLVVECFVPDRCRLDVLSFEDRSVISAKFIANNTRVTFGAVLQAGSTSVRVPYASKVDLSLNGQSLSSVESLAIIKGSDNEIIQANAKITLHDRRTVECQRSLVIREAMRLVSPVSNKVWFWKEACPVRVQTRGGSGRCGISTPSEHLIVNITMHGQILAPSRVDGHARSFSQVDGLALVDVRDPISLAPRVSLNNELRILDEDFYPHTQIDLSLSSMDVASIGISQSPPFAVQGSTIRVKLHPRNTLRAAEDLETVFDFGSFNPNDVKLTWTPFEAFKLHERISTGEFVLSANPEFEGKGHFHAEICSSCASSKTNGCVRGLPQEFIVERRRTAAVLPGNTYDLATCFPEGTGLQNCQLLNATEHAQVLSNGTLTAGCEPGKTTMVECQLRGGEKVLIGVLIDFPLDIDLMPFRFYGNEWILVGAQNKRVQVQARMRFAIEPTCELATTFLNKRPEFDFSLVRAQDERTLKHRKVVSLARGLATTMLDAPASVSKAKLEVFSRVSECGVHRAIKARMPVSISSIASPSDLPVHVLIPPESSYKLATSSAVVCRLASNCGSCEGIRVLPNCVFESRPMLAAGPCLVEVILAKSVVGVQSSSVEHVPLHLVAVESSPIGGFEADIASSDRTLNMKLFDLFGRSFIRGWTDLVPDTRVIDVEHSKHVQVEYVSSASSSKKNVKATASMNATSLLDGPVLRLSTNAKKAQSWVRVVFKERGRLLGDVLLDKLERKCERLFLGYFCLDDLEMFVLVLILFAGGVVALARQSLPVEPGFFVILAAIAVYFAAF